jgi:hypothetical protein
MKKVYAYYQSIATANQREEFACANVWKASWEDYNWSPVMLNASHAKACPLYNKLQQKLMNVAIGIPQDLAPWVNWINARFIRWAALHAAGGGWLTDYDVVNCGFTPEVAETYETDTLILNQGPAHIIYASQTHAEGVIRKLISEPLTINIRGENHIRSESEIVGIDKGIGDIAQLIHHARKSENSLRSEEMAILVQ